LNAELGARAATRTRVAVGCTPGSTKMHEAIISVLSATMRLLPDRLPGKTRLGRTLLRPFLSRTPALLNDCFGCSFVLPSYAEPMAQHIFTFGAYEPETREAILRFLPETGTFIDVGANTGVLAIPLAKARPRARIVCVEADPAIHALLA
jgi:hypothetical protein